MSKVSIEGNASGTGTLTIAAPNTNSNFTLTLPTNSGTIITGSGGVVGVAQGGTGASTLTANNVILGNGTSAVGFVAPGSNGNVLTSNGTTWTSSAPPAGGVTSLNGETGAITNTNFGAIGSYCMLVYAITANTNSTNRWSSIAVDATIAGSSLRYSTIGTVNNNTSGASWGNGFLEVGSKITGGGTSFPTSNTATVSGTWRLVGTQNCWVVQRLVNCGTEYQWNPMLFVRIS